MKRKREQQEEEEEECEELKDPPAKRHRLFQKIEDTKIRLPWKNSIPNLFVSKKENDKRGKKRVSGNSNNTNSPIHDARINYSSSDHCSGCGSLPDRWISFRREGTTVCQDCSIVQSGQIIDQVPDTPPTKMAQKGERRAYLSEKIRQMANEEPRIPQHDLEIIRRVHDEFVCLADQDPNYFERWSNPRGPIPLRRPIRVEEEKITREDVKELLRFIDHLKIPPKHKSVSFRKKYLERWQQIKVALTGSHYYYNHVANKPTEELLDRLLKTGTLVTEIYDTDKSIIFPSSPPPPPEKEDDDDCCPLLKKKGKPGPKKNVPNLDILFLLILYNIDEQFLELHGWYWVSKTMHLYAYASPAQREKYRQTKFASVVEDYKRYKKILRYCNQHYPKLIETALDQTQFILPDSLETLVHIAARNETAYQYDRSTSH